MIVGSSKPILNKPGFHKFIAIDNSEESFCKVGSTCEGFSLEGFYGTSTNAQG
jgi:hypothetical protein